MLFTIPAKRTNVRSICKLVIITLFWSSATAFSYAPPWKLFSSDEFTIQYPSAWYSTGAWAKKLQILSSKGGAEGIIIKKGQALINVEQVESPKQMSEVIDLYTHETTELSRSNIPFQSDHRCVLTEVVSKEPAIPPEDATGKVPYIINTEFFCALNNRNIVLVLRNWEGDKRQSQYQEVALRMAKSIRLKGQR
jgi:hypothetical protein